MFVDRLVSIGVEIFSEEMLSLSFELIKPTSYPFLV